MNNNLNQDNYLLNQNTQQQYLNIQSYETQGGQTQKTFGFEYSNEFQDPQRRVDFVKNMYNFLTLEFFVSFLLIALGICSGMFEWLYYTIYECQYISYDEELCGFYEGPTWLFYVSLSISLLLQFSLYFGINTLRKDSFTFLLLIPQLIFYGFFIATLSIFVTFQLGPVNVLISMGVVFLIIISQTIYLNLNIGDISFITCSILIAIITIVMLIILSCLRNLRFIECFLCSLFSTSYSFYLMFETKLMMCKGTIQLQSSNSLTGSLFLFPLIMQSLVRIWDFIYIACGR